MQPKARLIDGREMFGLVADIVPHQRRLTKGLAWSGCQR